MRLFAESWEIVATLGDCQHIAKEAISWRAPGALKDTNFFFFFFCHCDKQRLGSFRLAR